MTLLPVWRSGGLHHDGGGAEEGGGGGGGEDDLLGLRGPGVDGERVRGADDVLVRDGGEVQQLADRVISRHLGDGVAQVLQVLQPQLLQILILIFIYSPVVTPLSW